MMKPGDLAALSTPQATALLASATPARLAYVASDGTPRVVPICFLWTGTDLVFGSAPDTPKVAAIAAHPAVAVTIDTAVWPFQALTVRGQAEVTMVDGVVPEYALAVERYMGAATSAAWLTQVRTTYARMARIALTPAWAWLIDYSEAPEPH
jgi:hypothetical protein